MPGGSPVGAALDLAGWAPAVVVGSNTLVGLAFWSAVIVVLATLEALSHRSAATLPGVGDLVARYLRHPVARGVAVAAWLFAGYHLFSH